MGAKRLTMKKIKEILRCRLQGGLSSVRELARATQCGRTVLTTVLPLVRGKELNQWVQVEKLSEEELEALLYPQKQARLADGGGDGESRQAGLPSWMEVHEELRRDSNLTLMLLWTEYRVNQP